MFLASCCGNSLQLDLSSVLVWMWLGRILAALVLAEAGAVFTLVGRHRLHRWRLWEQKFVVWLGALSLLCAAFAQYAAAQYQRLAGMGATGAFGCPSYDCAQAVLASLTGTALLGTVMLAAAAVTLLLGLWRTSPPRHEPGPARFSRAAPPRLPARARACRRC